MDLITTLKNSPFWNETYDNYNATTQEGKDFLESLGFVVSWSRNYKDCIPLDIGVNVLVGFDKIEPDYGSYKHDYEAKEARPTYSPVFGYVYDISEVNAKIEETEKEKQEFMNNVLERIESILPELSQRVYNEFIENEEKYIVPINGRKYHYEYRGKKFETLEDVYKERELKARDIFHADIKFLEDIKEDILERNTLYIKREAILKVIEQYEQ